MRKRTVIVGAVILVAAGAAAFVTRDIWRPQGAVAQAPQPGAGGPPRGVPVEVATAAMKTVPVRIELLGTVTPIASVAVKPRIDSEILEVNFRDGAIVRQGEPLFTLDARTIDAQIKQAEGTLARDRAQLEGAERDVRRYTELVEKNATPINNLDNAKTQTGIYRGVVRADEAQLENLRVQLSYTTIKAPITGRISMAAAKVGNFARQADPTPLATIIQVAPVYVTFSLPQRNLPDVRQAISQETASIEAVIPGDTRKSSGQVTMVENSVDAGTGMVAIRATMPNADETLWPGTLVSVRLTLREEKAIAIPTVAVQVSQQGTFVFVIKNGVATVVPVKVSRVVEQESVIQEGLTGGEIIVTDGHLLLTQGTRVAPRQPRAGS